MIRILIIITFLLLSQNAFADEESGKAEFKKLYAEFNDLYANSASFDPILKSATKLHDLAPRIYGKNSKEHAAVTYNLAKVYDELGNETKILSVGKQRAKKIAAQYYEDYFDILAELKTPKDITYVQQYLSFVLAKTLGTTSTRYQKKYPSRLIKYAEDINLPESEIADIEFAVALAIINIRYYDLGQEYLKTSLERNIKLYGESHFKVGQNLFWRAKLDAGKGRYKAAEERYLKALSIFENNPKEGTELIGYTHAFLVALYEEMEEPEKATIHSQAIAVERVDGFDRNLEPLFRKMPERRRGVRANYGPEVTIEVEFTVDKEGKTKDIEITSSTDDYYNQTIIDAISKWRYAPTIKNGELIETHGVRAGYQFHP